MKKKIFTKCKFFSEATHFRIVCEKTLHVSSHGWVMELVSPVCSNWIAEEVVGDLVGKTWRYCVVINFIAHEMNCIAVTRKLYFAQKRPHRVRDKKVYLFGVLGNDFFGLSAFLFFIAWLKLVL